jgi:site-specific DNA recombinase
VLDGAAWAHVRELLTHPETIAAELERMQREDPGAADLEATERALTAVVREQRNLVENLGHAQGAAAVLIADKINALEAQREQYTAEREGLLSRRQRWQAALDRIEDLQHWCRRVAANLAALTYQEKRLALDALGVAARVWRTGHDPRYKIRASIPLDREDPVTPQAGIVGRTP